MPDKFPVSYDDIFDAIAKTVHSNPQGLNVKQIGSTLWPARNVDTARNTFSRAINPENTDVNLDPEELVKVVHICQNPEHVIYYLCDEFGFERPPRKDRRSFEREFKAVLKGIEAQMESLQRMAQRMDRMGADPLRQEQKDVDAALKKIGGKIIARKTS